ncbi:hypothetical protein PL371_16865 [Tenacibaculum maritimum]|nr:hypothetical protein [Tenacibaculum maritimum]MDB0613504.1 hypothetical protein [Tenacibaculum maritimum]
MKKLIIITLLSLCNFVYAQSKGTVSGTISDKEMSGEAFHLPMFLLKEAPLEQPPIWMVNIL